MPMKTLHSIGLAVGIVILVAWRATAQSPPLSGTAQVDFSIADRGAAALTTDGSGNNVGVGFATVQANTGSAVPAGVAVIAFRLNGTLVTEVGVPISPLLRTGRIYAEVSGPLDTGLAIANPNSQAATISFSFTDSDGVDFRTGSTIIPPFGQISTFLDQAPFNGGPTIHGAFSFSSDMPVSVVAIRGFVNERSEFLMSSLPVIDTSLATTTGVVTLPHFAAGGGWATRVILINPTEAAISGSLRFVASTGETLDTVPFSIPGRSSFAQLRSGTGAFAQTGSVQVVPGVGNVAPAAVAIFSYKPAGVTISEAAIVPVSGTSLRLYSEAVGAPGTAGTTQSGVAVANLSSTPATVTFEQSGLDGSPMATASKILPATGQIAQFITDIFASQTLQQPLQGVLRITTSGSGLSVAGLRGRYNERGDFLITTTPPTNEVAAISSSSAASVFPEVAIGGGYNTQFLLYSGSAGQTASGKVRFTNQNGSMPLSLNCPTSGTATGSTQPAVIRRVEPQYSEAARQAKITGTVIMAAVIHEDGSLSITQFLQTIGYGLDENARSALEQWWFCPGTLNGQPVAISLTIQVTFNLI
jgi:TonB family protein